MVNNVFHQGVV